MPTKVFKTNPLEIPLSIMQEKFCVGVVIEEKSQYQAYVDAGYKTEGLRRHQVDKRVYDLVRKPNIQRRMNELFEEKRKRNLENAMWTREMAIESNKYLYRIGKAEIDQAVNSYNREIEELENAIMTKVKNNTFTRAEDVSEIAIMKEKIEKLERSRKIAMTPSAAMRGAIDSLNRMHGYDKASLDLAVTNIAFTSDLKPDTPPGVTVVTSGSSGEGGSSNGS